MFLKSKKVLVVLILSSREFKGKYYHNIDGWFVAKIGEETVSPNNDEMPF